MNSGRYKIRGLNNERNRGNKRSFTTIMLVFILIFLSALYIIYNKYMGLGTKLPTINAEEKNKDYNTNDKNSNIKNEYNNELIKENSNTNDLDNNFNMAKGKMEFYVMQYGVFKNEDNAKKVQDTLKNNISTFIFKEDDLFKVIGGVYLGSNIEEVINKNKDMEVECSKIPLCLDLQEDALREVGKIVDGSLKVLNKFNDSKVKSITTEDLKQWVNKLNLGKELNNSPNYNKLKDIKAYINNLPSEINRNNLNENYKYIYSFLKKR